MKLRKALFLIHSLGQTWVTLSDVCDIFNAIEDERDRGLLTAADICDLVMDVIQDL